MTVTSFRQDMNLFSAEWRRSLKLMKTYPIDTVNNIISFMIMSVVFMVGVNAVGDSTQVFGVMFFPVMLNLIGGPSASIRGDIELGVFEQVYISRYTLIKTAIMRTVVSGVTSLIGSVLIAVVMHIFFLKLNISFLSVLLLFALFSVQSLTVGVLMAAVTLRFRKVDTLLNFFNILIMIELVLPLHKIMSVMGHLPVVAVPFYGVVVLYQQILEVSTAAEMLPIVICTALNTFVLVLLARLVYKKSMLAAKKMGVLGQY
jgi:ABC-type polysaccharide/polyol phosphate export permease